MKISIIIPTLNEERNIEKLISFICLQTNPLIEKEVIVADGNSTDSTVKRALEAGATVVNCSIRSRSIQMNNGAAAATGDIFYFLHADSIPPENFAKDILNAVESGYNSGCYRLLTMTIGF